VFKGLMLLILRTTQNTPLRCFKGLISAVNGGKWSASRPPLCTFHGTH